MTEGEKLYITVRYAFNYNDSHFEHIYQFDILTQFFEHRNNLKGFISDEEGDRVEEYSEVAVLIDRLYEGFDNKDMVNLVKNLLIEYEMYEILVDYKEPVSIKGIEYKNKLLNGK